MELENMKYLRVSEAAKLYGVGEDTIYKNLKEGILTGRKLVDTSKRGGTTLVSHEDLKRWIRYFNARKASGELKRRSRRLIDYSKMVLDEIKSEKGL